MTTATLSYRAVNHKFQSVSFPRINWKIVYMLAILLSVVMLVFYVYLVNQLTRGTYLIKNYNKEISALSKENNSLETSFAQSGFLGSVQDKVTQLSFEKTTEVKYVQILGNSLAKLK